MTIKEVLLFLNETDFIGKLANDQLEKIKQFKKNYCKRIQ